MAYFIDTSALVKLVIEEEETQALREWIDTLRPRLISSDLVRTELGRAVRRQTVPQVFKARQVLETLAMFPLTAELCDAAARLEPSQLRSLDALHVASALSLGDLLDAVVTYDERMAEACAVHGIQVLAPA